MSGGHFDYLQGRIEYEAADGIRSLIDSNEEKDEYGYSRSFSPETLKRFEEAEKTLRKAAAMLQRVDYLVCGDDGEETFHKRWEKEVEGKTDEAD